MIDFPKILGPIGIIFVSAILIRDICVRNWIGVIAMLIAIPVGYSFGSFLAYLKKIEMKHKREKRRLIYLSIDVLKVVMMEFINSNVFIVKVLFSYKIFISLLFIVGIVEQSLKELGSFMSIL